MRKLVTVLSIALASLVAGQALADDHLVTPQAARAQRAGRRGRARTVAGHARRHLVDPEAVKAAAAVGADTAQLRAALPTLSDAEIADLAARANALQRTRWRVSTATSVRCSSSS